MFEITKKKTNTVQIIRIHIYIYIRTYIGRDVVVVRLLRSPTHRRADGGTASRMGFQRFQRVRFVRTGFDDYRGNGFFFFFHMYV